MINAQKIIPHDSRYIPLTQQRWCCVPTCIQMIMLRYGVPLVPAELIGFHLGLMVPSEELVYFWNGVSGERPPAGFGTRIYLPHYSPNAMFKKLHIPLHMDLHLIDTFPNFEVFKQFLSDVERQDRDVLVCYDWGTLFDSDQHTGHVCVLDKLLETENTVRIIDPEYKAPKWRIVNTDKLYESMKFHGPKKSGGFWELIHKRHDQKS